MVDQAWHQDGITFLSVLFVFPKYGFMVFIIKKNTHIYRGKKISSVINTIG